MERYARLDELESGFVEKGLIPGVAYGVIRDGEIDHTGAYGYADLEAKKTMTTDTLFELYSTTKVIVMTACMILFERGKFLLQDPLSDYIGYNPTEKFVFRDGRWEREKLNGTIRIWHALHMSMGLPYAFADSEIPSARAMAEVKERLTREYGGDGKWGILKEIQEMSSVPVMFEPGEGWMYGYGHELASALITSVSGMSTSEFLKKEIFDPLGMSSTGYRVTQLERSRLAAFYTKSERGFERIPFVSDTHSQEYRLENGGAGLVSSVNDYLRFAAMLVNGGTYHGERILSRKTIDLMRADRLTTERRRAFDNTYNGGYGYGLGVRVMTNPGAYSNLSVGEFGWTGMLGTYVSVDPSEKFAIVHMHQLSPNNEEYIHHRVRHVAYATL
ncbi:MAG: serine hydrolase domain-containing protein [Christensenellaceae bacterium]